MAARARPSTARRALWALAAGCAVQLPLGVRPSAACDLASSHLEPPTVGAAVADVVAVVDVISVAGGVAAVQIVETFKGSVSRGDRIQIQGVVSAEDAARGRDCGVSSMGAGKRYLVLLWSPTPSSPPEYHLVDPAGGVTEDGVAARAALKEAVAKQQPHSRWKAGPLGLRAQLAVSAEPGAAKGDLDLLVVLRNTGKVAIELRYESWPESVQSRCSLQMDHVASRKRVDAQEVPIPKKDIADYFSRVGRRYRLKIEPGQAHVLLLPRVTTAVSGWGYKEELGFRYYPVAQHGLHAISAECVNLFGPGTVVATEALEVGL